MSCFAGVPNVTDHRPPPAEGVGRRRAIRTDYQRRAASRGGGSPRPRGSTQDSGPWSSPHRRAHPGWSSEHRARATASEERCPGRVSLRSSRLCGVQPHAATAETRRTQSSVRTGALRNRRRRAAGWTLLSGSGVCFPCAPIPGSNDEVKRPPPGTTVGSRRTLQTANQPSAAQWGGGSPRPDGSTQDSPPCSPVNPIPHTARAGGHRHCAVAPGSRCRAQGPLSLSCLCGKEPRVATTETRRTQRSARSGVSRNRPRRAPQLRVVSRFGVWLPSALLPWSNGKLIDCRRKC